MMRTRFSCQTPDHAPCKSSGVVLRVHIGWRYGADTLLTASVDSEQDVQMLAAVLDEIVNLGEVQNLKDRDETFVLSHDCTRASLSTMRMAAAPTGSNVS